MVAKVKNKLPLTFTRFVGTLDDMIAKAKCTQKNTQYCFNRKMR